MVILEEKGWTNFWEHSFVDKNVWKVLQEPDIGYTQWKTRHQWYILLKYESVLNIPPEFVCMYLIQHKKLILDVE